MLNVLLQPSFNSLTSLERGDFGSYPASWLTEHSVQAGFWLAGWTQDQGENRQHGGGSFSARFWSSHKRCHVMFCLNTFGEYLTTGDFILHVKKKTLDPGYLIAIVHLNWENKLFNSVFMLVWTSPSASSSLLTTFMSVDNFILLWSVYLLKI